MQSRQHVDDQPHADDENNVLLKWQPCHLAILFSGAI